MNRWGYVLAAYGLAAAVLLGYWRRIESRIRGLEQRKGTEKTR